MAKKEQFLKVAEQMYVSQQFPVTVIAEKLQLNEKTLYTWKKEHNWEEKRNKFLISQYSCNEALYDFLKVVTKDLQQCYANGEEPSKTKVNLFGKLVDKMPKLKEFEEELLFSKTAENKNSENINTAILDAIDKHLRGE